MANLDLIFEEDLDAREGEVKDTPLTGPESDEAASVQEVKSRISNPGSRLSGVVRGW